MRRVLAMIAVVALAGGVACDKKSGDSTAASGSVSAAAPPSASASASAIAANPGAPRRFKGTYTADRASYYLPDAEAYKGVKFRGDDAGDALGDGTLSITIDKDGIVSGEGAGPLGAITIAGIERDGDVTFTVARKDANDMGPTGTGLGTLSEKSLDGTMRLSAYRAQVIREASFKLKAE